ncbi:MAG: acyltransferase [Pirellulales bacterium]
MPFETSPTPIASQTNATKNRVVILDPLRGAAALAVCFFHFGAGNGALLPAHDPFRQISAFGSLGVEVFFVISGFVVPLTVQSERGSKVSRTGFLIKRLKRLHPPYLISILVLLAANHFASLFPGFRGPKPEINAGELAAHLAYLNGVLGYDWLNPVYWTLGIEFQYYLVVTTCLPLFAHPKREVRIGTILVHGLMNALFPLPGYYVLHWLPLFGLGSLSLEVVKHGAPWVPVLIFQSLLAFAFGWHAGWLPAVVGLTTAIGISASGKLQSVGPFQPLTWVGLISYSVYLLHIPLGSKIINLSTRLNLPTPVIYLAPAIAVAVSLVAGYIFWRMVETPAQNWSRGKALFGPASGPR